MNTERYEILGQIVEAAKMVCASEKVAPLIPEVRSNITMCTSDPKTPEDVAGIPGRITVINGRPAVYAYPDWAASVNTSYVLIMMHSLDKNVRSVMEIRYSPGPIEALSKAGYTLYEIPDSDSWESTMKKGLTAGHEEPPIFHSKGDWAREGAVIVSGPDAVTVAKKVLKIAELL